MPTTNPWAPDEPASAVHSEEAWLQGALISCIAYGVLLVLYLHCTYLLWKQTKPSNYRSNVPLLVLVFVVFMFGSFFVGSNMMATQQSFIQDRNFPGGPSAFENDTPSANLGTVSNVLSQWLCDATIIWRYMMIYKGCVVPAWLIRTPPIIVYLGSIAVGILFLAQISVASPFHSSNINWTIPYLSISLGLNIILTIAIVGRLLFFRHRISSAVGLTHGSPYTSVAAMLVESASVYAVFSLLLLIPFALNNSVASLSVQVIGQAQGIATLLIVLRVASGKAWSTDTNETLVSMQFSPQSMAQTTESEIVSTSERRRRKSTCSKSRSTSTVYHTSGRDDTKDADTSAQSLDEDFAKEAYDRV